MVRYSQERKEAVLRKMLPPNGKSIAAIAKEEGICDLPPFFLDTKIG